MKNKIGHIEIAVKDIKQAKEFYEKVFSWEVELETGYEGYAFFKDSGKETRGGFTESDKTSNGAILLHIEVEDIEKMLEKIEKHGGTTIQGKTQIENDYGFYAIFEDVFGNVLALWSEK